MRNMMDQDGGGEPAILDYSAGLRGARPTYAQYGDDSERARERVGESEGRSPSGKT